MHGCSPLAAKGFAAADVISFFVQAGGGALMADQYDTWNGHIGRKIKMVQGEMLCR